jgi:hypoxanthine phosphoribosyltransferase
MRCVRCGVRLLDKNAQIAAAAPLAERLRRFDPRAVIFIREGGSALGLSLAALLEVPAIGLDLCYPWRRRLDALPLPLRVALWPLKEFAYRATFPRPARNGLDAPPLVERAVLVDDTASSGRTLRAAFELLEARGIPRTSLRVAVIRCGERAKAEVDAWFTDEKAWTLR